VTAAILIALLRLREPPQAMPSVTFTVTHVEDTQPEIIHVYNLDDGPRAILLSRVRSEESDPAGPVRILNASISGNR
jgi:hypothetical protein